MSLIKDCFALSTATVSVFIIQLACSQTNIGTKVYSQRAANTDRAESCLIMHPTGTEWAASVAQTLAIIVLFGTHSPYFSPLVCLSPCMSVCPPLFSLSFSLSQNTHTHTQYRLGIQQSKPFAQLKLIRFSTCKTWARVRNEGRKREWQPTECVQNG